jgi:hypothetical protein
LSLDIGVSILCTGRFNCLERLVNSIEKYTDEKYLGKIISIFVLDDSPKGKEKNKIQRFCKNKRFIKYHNTGERIGIVNNSNNALKCLKSFHFKLMLNNDVEILKKGWYYFYFDAMEDTGYHHFCMQQQGLWGHGTKKKRPFTISKVNGVEIRTIQEKPMGAVMSFDKLAQDTVGYYDNIFPKYGMSHHDWTNRVSLSGIQPSGIHDLKCSNSYFEIHDEACSTPQKDRIKLYIEAKKIYEKVRNDKKRIYIDV